MSSLVSAKGPSIRVRLSPEKRTRLPFELGWSPSPASITPAFTSSSLNFPISASSFCFGMTPASESFVALTITMHRIVMSPLDLEYSDLYFDVERRVASSTSPQFFLVKGLISSVNISGDNTVPATTSSSGQHNTNMYRHKLNRKNW